MWLRINYNKEGYNLMESGTAEEGSLSQDEVEASREEEGLEEEEECESSDSEEDDGDDEYFYPLFHWDYVDYLGS